MKRKYFHSLGQAVVILAVNLFVLTACSDPNEANEDNFAVAIQEYLSLEPACLNWPDERTYNMLYSRDRKLDALVKAGLLELHTFEPNAAAGTRRTQYQYILSKKGRQLSGIEDNAMAQGRLRTGEGIDFCYAKQELVSIDTFTPPQAMGPYTVSEVKYIWKLTDIQDWVRDKTLEGAFELKDELESGSIKDKEVLALTNKGWRHISFMKK